MYVRKKTYEIELKSEECLERLTTKCDEEKERSIEDYKLARPLNTRVRFSMVPGQFPNAVIMSLLTEKTGRVIKHQIEEDEDGLRTGRRFYWFATNDLMTNPIPERVTISGRTMWVQYINQPTICFKCKKTGHKANECTSNDEKSDNKADESDSTSKTNEEDDPSTPRNVSSMANAFERQTMPTDLSVRSATKRGREKTNTSPNAKTTNIPSLDPTAIDPTDPNDVNWARALSTCQPPDVTPRRGAGMKECDICKKHLSTGLTAGDLIIGRCNCNENTRSHVLVKCNDSNCNDWFSFPSSRAERVMCSCGRRNFLCSCSMLHSVSGNKTDYQCLMCLEHVDPPLL